MQLPTCGSSASADAVAAHHPSPLPCSPPSILRCSHQHTGAKCTGATKGGYHTGRVDRSSSKRVCCREGMGRVRGHSCKVLCCAAPAGRVARAASLKPRASHVSAT
eukprot:1161226-Pelagomonas_calceolata.AAC.15